MAKASKIRIFSVEEVGKISKGEITISKEYVDYIIVSKNGAYPTGCNGKYVPNLKVIGDFIKNG